MADTAFMFCLLRLRRRRKLRPSKVSRRMKLFSRIIHQRLTLSRWPEDALWLLAGWQWRRKLSRTAVSVLASACFPPLKLYRLRSLSETGQRRRCSGPRNRRFGCSCKSMISFWRLFLSSKSFESFDCPSCSLAFGGLLSSEVLFAFEYGMPWITSSCAFWFVLLDRQYGRFCGVMKYLRSSESKNASSRITLQSRASSGERHLRPTKISATLWRWVISLSKRPADPGSEGHRKN